MQQHNPYRSEGVAIDSAPDLIGRPNQFLASYGVLNTSTPGYAVPPTEGQYLQDGFSRGMTGFDPALTNSFNQFSMNSDVNALIQTPTGLSYAAARNYLLSQPHVMQQMLNSQGGFQEEMPRLSTNLATAPYPVSPYGGMNTVNQAYAYAPQANSFLSQHQIIQKMLNSENGFPEGMQGSPHNLISNAPDQSYAVPYTRSLNPQVETMTANSGFLTGMGPSPAINPRRFRTEGMNLPAQTYAVPPVNASHSQGQK